MFNENLTKEWFQDQLRALLPGTKAGTEEIWVDFARECVESKQYVDFTPEPDETAQSRWYDTLLASFVLLKRDFGEEVATAICDLSLTNQCLYPCEMERAGLELKEGGDADDILQLMEEGKLESLPLIFPKLRDTAPHLVPKQGPEMISQL